MPSSIIKAYNDTGYQGKGLSLEESRQAFAEVASTFDQVYICVDALDELDEGQQPDLLNLIADLATEGRHVLISSRMSHLIHRFEFANQHRVYPLHVLHISDDDTRMDVDSFIYAKIQSSVRLRSESELQSQILRKSVKERRACK